MTRKTILFLGAMTLLLAGLFAACTTPQPTTQTQPTTKPMEPVKDPHSFANSHEVLVKHLDLDLGVDFDKKEIAGRATLQIENRAGARELRLDTRDLTIEKVTLDDTETETKFAFGDEVKYQGRPLTIEITPATKAVNVHYRTAPTAAALQWLDPSQTAGGKKPFLFTQSQAILARSWVPCQDTPSVRQTYHAKVKTRPDLLAVMSATNAQQINPQGVYEFDMKQANPSYRRL